MSAGADRTPEAVRERYRTLPEPVRLADTVEVHDPLPPPDPTAGRDPERDFVLRYAG